MREKEMRRMIEWLDNAGHSDLEIMSCIRYIVGAPRRGRTKGEEKEILQSRDNDENDSKSS